MSNKNLLLAFVICLLTLCGVLYFSASGTALSTAQIVVISLGALAWLGLFLFARQPANQELNSLHSKGSANTLTQEFSGLISSMQTELGAQISATDAELKQVKTLMDGAIDDLVDSFISLEASTRTEQKLVMLLVSSQNVNDKDELNPFREMQLKSKQLLLETSQHLNKMIKDAKQNETACKSIANMEKTVEKSVGNLELSLSKFGKTADAALVDKVRESAKAMHSAINDASKVANKLHSNSKLLSEESKEVADKVATMIKENGNNMTMVADEIAATSQQIEKDVQMAVKSLQFQDMTSQLITQCGERQKIMQDVLDTINSINHDSTSKISLSDLQTKLANANAELKQASKVRMKQFNVDGGSVELF
jgi:methyl-accepting chemotaxis protein